MNKLAGVPASIGWESAFDWSRPVHKLLKAILFFCTKSLASLNLLQSVQIQVGVDHLLTILACCVQHVALYVSGSKKSLTTM